MTENQKLREALQAISNIDDATNHSVDAAAALGRIGQIAWQALALPTAEQPRIRIPTDAMEQAFQSHYRRGFEAGKRAAMPTADHLPDAGKMINGLTQAETDASASVSGLTAAPVDDRERFEQFAQNCPMGKYNVARRGEGYDSSHTQIMWDAWQARAALIAGDAVDAQRYRWLMDNCTLGIKQNGVGWSLNTSACVAPDCIKDVGDAIDAAMRKDKP